MHRRSSSIVLRRALPACGPGGWLGQFLVPIFVLLWPAGCRKTGQLHAGEGGAKGAQDLVVRPDTATLNVGHSLQLIAMATFDSGSLHDITADVEWSQDCEALTVSNDVPTKGLVFGVAPGTCEVRATSATFTATSEIVVSADSSAALQGLSIASTTTELPAGLTQVFTAQGTFDDGTTKDVSPEVDWTSDSDGAILRFSAETRGSAIALAEGDDVVSVRGSGGIVATLPFKVTSAVLREIDVVLPLADFVVGFSPTLKAYGIFSDGTTRDISSDVVWTSSDASVVAFNAAERTGLAALAHAGDAELTATLGAVSSSVPVHVGDSVLTSVSCAPRSVRVPVGFTRQLTLDATLSDGKTLDVTSAGEWASSVPTLAAVDNNGGGKGNVRAHLVGNSTVSATFGGRVASSDIEVIDATLVELKLVPESIAAAPSVTTPLTATGIFSDGSVEDLSGVVVWASSNATVATVGAAAPALGVVLAKAAGEATVSATVQGLVASTTVTVRDVVITAIAVAPAVAQVAAGYQQPFTATATLSDGTTQDVTDLVTWRSLDAAIAVVTNDATAFGAHRGVVLARASGLVSVEASFGGHYGAAAVTVTQASLVSLSLTPSSPSIPLGSSARLAAHGTFSDGTVLDVTSAALWTSLDPGIATVEGANPNRGLVKARALGQATVRASIDFAGGVELVATSAVEVSAIAVRAVTVLPSPIGVGVGGSVPLFATATFTDNSTLDITESSTWQTLNDSLATVDTEGIVLGLAVGTTKVSATYQGITSNLVTTTVSAAAPPPDPTSIGASTLSASTVRVAWQSGGGTTAGFTIAYRLGAVPPASCASGNIISPVAIGVATAYDVSGLQGGSEYSFRVCADNVDLVTSPGATVIVRTPFDIPPDPTNLQVAVPDATSIRLSWGSGGGSTTAFVIAYNQGAAPSDCESGSVIDSGTIGGLLTYTVGSLGTDQLYGFRVCALNGNATPDMSPGVTIAATTGVAVGSITVTEPNTATTYPAYDPPPLFITWTSTNVTGTVTIKYSSDGGATFPVTIAANEPNDGGYLWSMGQPFTSHGRIRVESDADARVFDYSDVDFYISLMGM